MANMSEKLELVIEAVDRATVTVNKVSQSLGSMNKGLLATGAGAVALGGIIKDIAVKAFQSLKDAIMEGVDAAMEAEVAEARLSQALKNTGQNVEDGVSAFKSLASQLQATTTYEDDAIISAAALGTQLGLTQDEVTKLLPAVTDMASALGMDLESAMRMVAKSIEGSGGALSRWGISTEEAAKSGNKLDGIVAQLNEKFGGQAEAMASTTKGELEQMNVAWGNTKEAIGDVIIKSDLFRAGMDLARSAMSALTGAIDQKRIWDDFSYNLEQAARRAQGLSYSFRGIVQEKPDEAVKVTEQLNASQEKALQSALRAEDLSKRSRKELESLVASKEAFGKLSEEQQTYLLDLLQKQLDAETAANEEAKKGSEERVKAAEEKAKAEADYLEAMRPIEQEITQMTADQILTIQAVKAGWYDLSKQGLADFTWWMNEMQSIGAATVGAITDSMANSVVAMVTQTKGAGEALKQIWADFGTFILGIIAKMIAKFLVLKILTSIFNAASGVGAIANFALGGISALGGSMQTHFGETKTIPGPVGAPVPIIAHGQEIIGRPDSGGSGSAVTVMGDVFGWDESMERIRNGLYRHGQMTGATVMG